MTEQFAGCAFLAKQTGWFCKGDAGAELPCPDFALDNCSALCYLKMTSEKMRANSR
jgi:hypothetical protein